MAIANYFNQPMPQFDDAAPAIARDIVADWAPRPTTAARALGGITAPIACRRSRVNALRMIRRARHQDGVGVGALDRAEPDVNTRRRRASNWVELMRLAGEHRNAERQPAAIAQEVQLRTKSAFGAAKRVVSRFGRRPPFLRAPAAARLARMLVLSILQDVPGSICPL